MISYLKKINSAKSINKKYTKNALSFLVINKWPDNVLKSSLH